MKERPILFSAPMVQAILDGRKTMTRRVIRQFPATGYRWGGWIVEGARGDEGKATIVPEGNMPYMAQGQIKTRCPYGQPGDRLWVRETWRVGAWQEEDDEIAVDYFADDFSRKEWLCVPGSEQFIRLWTQSTDDAEKALGRQDRYEWEPGASPCRWRPSIHMPRWASRIFLEVTAVRVDRVQDISEDDALAEGVTRELRAQLGYASEVSEETFNFTQARDTFRILWDSINAKRGYGWDANPWVWVVEFKRIEP